MYGLKGVIAASMSALLLSAAPIGASAQEAQETVSSETMAATEASFSIAISEIETENSSLGTGALVDIFSGQIEPYASEIQSLNADSIVVPEIKLTITSAENGGAQTTLTVTYTDIRVENVVDGVAGSVSIGNSVLENSDPDAGTINIQSVSAKSVNFGAMLAFYGLVDNTNSELYRIIYKDAVIEGGTLVAPDVNCTIGRFDFSELRARETSVSIVDLISIATQLEAQGDTPDSALLAQMFGNLTEIAAAYEMMPARFDGLSCAGLDDDGQPIEITVGPVEIGAYADLIYPRISMNDWLIKAQGGEMTLGNVTLKPIDYSNFFETISEATEELNDAWFEAHARELVPEIEGLSFSDFAMDIADESNSDRRIIASVGGFDLGLSDYLNGIPTIVSATIDDLHVQLPNDPTDRDIMRLIDAGIDAIDLDATLRANWDSDSENITIDRLALSAAKLGSIDLSLLIGNAGRDLFATDPQTAMIAGMGVTAKSLGISFTDEGIMQFAVRQFAAERGMDVESVPIMMSGMAQGLVLGFLGSNPNGADLATAIGTFLNGGKSINAKFTSVNPNGISVPEFAAMEDDPSQIADMITIEASAE